MRFPQPLALFVFLTAACDPASDSAKDSRTWSKCETLTMIQDRRISESSGICASHREAGIYYTHNDSGDSARFFKFDRAGKVLATYEVSNAQAIDWEDCASATIGGKPFLYFGDVGDNAGKREDIVIYRIPEPSGPSKAVVADRVYTLTYDDEPHNAEALMVDPVRGDLIVVTKAAAKPSGVFVVSRPGRSGKYVLRRQGELQVGGDIRESRLITGGDIAPDGKHLVLRTYMAAWEFAFSTSWFKQTPLRIQTNFEFQGEGICYARDGKAILTTSEGSPCQVSQAQLN